MGEQTFEIPAFEPQCGGTINLKLAYRVYGELSSTKDNLIVVPTHYGGRSDDVAFLIGEEMALDPRKYCIVVPNLFGNGVSSSPSNTPAPFAGKTFPTLTYYDNVVCQRRMIEAVFGAKQVCLVVGFSMGAMQAYEWATQAPNLVQRFAAICGSARTYEHNQLFLDSVCAALTADSVYRDGTYTSPPTRGLEAFSVAYAAWFASQQFYSEQIYRIVGFERMQDVVDLAKSVFMAQDANDLLAMAATWRAGDPSANPVYNGDFEKAIRSIAARGLVMPCVSDLYFRVSDNKREVALLNNAELAPIQSDFGHLAGAGLDPTAIMFINGKLSELLAS